MPISPSTVIGGVQTALNEAGAGTVTLSESGEYNVYTGDVEAGASYDALGFTYGQVRDKRSTPEGAQRLMVEALILMPSATKLDPVKTYTVDIEGTRYVTEEIELIPKSDNRAFLLKLSRS